MKKHFLLIAAAMAFGLLSVAAKDDVPRGYLPLSELKEAKEKSASENKLLVLVVKGLDDSCPNCAATLENGERGLGSGVIKVFARAETINSEDSSEFPQVMKDRVIRKFTTGAEVTFVVFDPEMSKIIAEAARKELQSNKKTIAEFKKTVQAAKKEYK